MRVMMFHDAKLLGLAIRGVTPSRDGCQDLDIDSRCGIYGTCDVGRESLSRWLPILVDGRNKHVPDASMKTLASSVGSCGNNFFLLLLFLAQQEHLQVCIIGHPSTAYNYIKRMQHAWESMIPFAKDNMYSHVLCVISKPYKHKSLNRTYTYLASRRPHFGNNTFLLGCVAIEQNRWEA